MISLVQRVLEAKVHIDNKEFSSIGSGLLVLICVEDSDKNESIEFSSLVPTLCDLFDFHRLLIFDSNFFRLQCGSLENQIQLFIAFTMQA